MAAKAAKPQAELWLCGFDFTFFGANDDPILNDVVTGSVVSLHLADQRDGVHFMSSSLITGFLLVDPEQLWVTGFRPLFAPTLSTWGFTIDPEPYGLPKFAQVPHHSTRSQQRFAEGKQRCSWPINPCLKWVIMDLTASPGHLWDQLLLFLCGHPLTTATGRKAGGGEEEKA